MDDFLQDGPRAPANTWDSDPLLRSLLRRFMPAGQWGAVESAMTRLGARAAGDLAGCAENAEANPPRHIPYGPWGERIDAIVTAPGWRALRRFSAEEGLVAAGYEREFGEFSRLYQFARLYLFHPSSAYYTCPLAMSDGAARLIECHGDEELKARVLPRLTSRDPRRFWTSGQWMTERAGGSDLGDSRSVARAADDGWRLHGTKWFTSAIDSQMAMTLARCEDAAGRTQPGSRGLSLFYLELRDADGALDHIQVLRLKDKLGTRALPTAELRLDGTRARLVGNAGEGVKTMATLFNVTRLYNACTSVGAWRRLLDLAIDYAGRRRAFGKPLRDHALHYRVLAESSVQFQASFHLAMYAARLLGREEVPGPDEHARAANRDLLRLLTPVAKLYCAKRNLAATSELLECFGGAGYIEDTGLPRWLRDNQVLVIWEGTTNVLSLDLLRAIAAGGLAAFLADVETRLAGLTDSAARRQTAGALDRLREYAGRLPAMEREEAEFGARALAFTLGNIMAASLLLEHAAAAGDSCAAAAAEQFCRAPLYLLEPASQAQRQALRALLAPFPAAV